MTTRMESMKRWNEMTFDQQQLIIDKDWVYKERNPSTLTGREIEELLDRLDYLIQMLDNQSKT